MLENITENKLVMSEITHQDVLLLNEDSSPEKRAILAQKIGYGLNHGELSITEKELALAICQQLASDVDVSVRTCLSENLKKCDEIPSEIAHKLAEDVLSVSLPFLEFSKVFSDNELIEISKSGDEDRQIAISKRDGLSASVAETLVEVGTEAVVETLVKNKSAELNDEVLETVLERFQNSPSIHTGMAERHNLSPHIIEKMIELVSDELKTYLATHHQVSNILAEKLVLVSREDAKKRLLSDPHNFRDAGNLVRELDAKDLLSNDLIIRALEVGDRAFFEHALAQRVGIPVSNAQKLIRDEGDKGFPALYKKSALPKEDFSAIQFMVQSEYHSRRNHPITSVAHKQEESQSWLDETKKSKGKWKLF